MGLAPRLSGDCTSKLWRAAVDAHASLDGIDLAGFRVHDFELVVIGSGPAGQKAAISAAKAGARVAIVERDPLAGGVCLNTGTIPSKTLREAVLYLTGYRQRGYYGDSYRLKDKITAGDLLERTTHVIRMERAVINDTLAANGIARLVGTARIAGPHEVDVTLAGDATRVTADNILIATGTAPRRPPEVPFDDINVFDSDAVFGRENELRPLPDSIIVMGAGVIGIEYASMFSALEIPVTLVDPRQNPLAFVDQEIAELLYESLRTGKGTRLVFGRSYTRIEALGPKGSRGRVHVTLDDGTELEADSLLFALGRIPATGALGLAELGVALDRRGNIVVNERYQTSVPSIWAAGDVIGFPSLASTSAEQGRVAALNAIGFPVSWKHDALPYGIYTIPELSMVGRTEEQLQQENVPYFVGTALWRDTARGKILGDLTGALKLLFHRETRALLGVHVIGEGATELLHIGQAVMHFGGGPDYFIGTVFNYPTLAEAYKIAAYNALNRLAGKAHHKERLLKQVYESIPVTDMARW
jgi:NAD(P) transhydrogenase